MDKPVKPIHGKYFTSFPFMARVLHVIDKMISYVDFSERHSFSITPPKSILISNVAAIGDAVLSTSVIPVLKSAFPEVEISFLIGSWSKPVFEGHPLVKRVHIVDHFYCNRNSKSLFWKIPCVVVTMGVAPHQWYPMHMAAKVLIENVDCIPCYRRGGCEGMECLREVSVSRVYKAVKEILQ